MSTVDFRKLSMMLQKNLFAYIVLLALLQHVFATLGRKHEVPFLPLTYYKPGAVLNFVCGFGIPVDDESVLAGIVFKSQHFLPASLADLRNKTTVNVHGGRKLIGSSAKDLSKYRWMLYKLMERAIDGLGHNGRVCVLRIICEAAALPIQFENGLLGEVLHILLTPTASKDAPKKEAKIYIAAEETARQGISCTDQYKQCEKSFLNQFTLFFD